MKTKPLMFGVLAVVLLSGVALMRSSHARLDKVARGKYLVTFGGCSNCHTPMKTGANAPEPDMDRFLSGHPSDVKLPPPPKVTKSPWFVTTSMTAWSGPWGISYASNLTPDRATGLGAWTEKMFMQAMRTGKHYGVARDLLPPMPWRSVAALTDEDLSAVFVYLQSIPTIRNEVPQPAPASGRVSYE